MSFIQKITRNILKNNQTLRSSQYVPGVADDKITRWLKTLNERASSPEAKGYMAQLSSMVHFYNRTVSKEIPSIDWKKWKNDITTVGLVDKVQANYEELAKMEYHVDPIAKQVNSSLSQELSSLDNELIFHNSIWLNCYVDYTYFLFELEEFGDPNDYLMHEHFDFFSGLEAELEELTETHNYIPGSKDDINLRGYMAAQFGWGKKVISFYRHPSDDFKCARCTKNILGR